MIAFDKLTKEQLYEFIDVFDELILKEYGWCRAYDKEAFLKDFLETIQKVGNVYCFYVDVKRKGGKKHNSRFFYFDALFFVYLFFHSRHQYPYIRKNLIFFL